MKKICGCGKYDVCDECRAPEQMNMFEFDDSYIHLMGLDEGWDPSTGRLHWNQEMKRAEIRKYLIKCECAQCESMGRKFRCGWIEIDAIWCIEARHRDGIKCPYCYHHFYLESNMKIEIEDCGTPSEEEIDRLGLDPEKFVGLESGLCKTS